MFAYCGNNPANYVDDSGAFASAALPALPALPANISKYIVALLMAVADGGTPVLEIATVVVVGLVSVAYTTEVEKKTQVYADAATSGDSSAIYYGADMVGDASGKKEWKIQTGPMDYQTAILWTLVTAMSSTYGKNANWGLYTEKQDDAVEMALALGGVGPCLHENRVGEYPHYHVNGMLLFGQYKHFHIWYGSINLE